MDHEKGYLPTSLADTDVSEDHHRLTYFDKIRHGSRVAEFAYIACLGLFSTLLTFETITLGVTVTFLRFTNFTTNEMFYLQVFSLMFTFFSLLACVVAKSATEDMHRGKLFMCILTWIADLVLVGVNFSNFSIFITIAHMVICCCVLVYPTKKLLIALTTKQAPIDNRRFSLDMIEIDTHHL